ncbi:MAG: MATE family efflux transporter [Planctomycetota bacterium]
MTTQPDKTPPETSGRPPGRIRQDLTTGSIAGAIGRLAPPIMLAFMVQVVINITALYFVGELGSEAVAAVGVSGQIIMIIASIFVGIGNASTALVARAVGAGDLPRADHVATQSILTAVALAVAVGVPGYFLAPRLLAMIGAAPGVVASGVGFLQINFIGLAVITALMVGGGVVRGAGDAVTPLVVTVIAAVVNVALVPVCVRGYLGCPALGVNGAAIAGLAAQTVGLACGAWVLATGRVRVRIRLREFRPDLAVIKSITFIGVPMSVQMALRGLMDLVLMGIAAHFGTALLAAYNIGMRLRMVGFMPGFGIAEAAAMLVGQNLGAGKPGRARQSALIAANLALVVMGGAGLLSYIYATPLMMVFAKDAAVIAAGTLMLKISAAGMAFAAVGIVLNRAIGGAGDSVPPMIITLVALWGFQAPAAYWMAHMPALGANGIWIAMVAAALLQAAATAAYFATGRWMRKKG